MSTFTFHNPSGSAYFTLEAIPRKTDRFYPTSSNQIYYFSGSSFTEVTSSVNNPFIINDFKLGVVIPSGTSSFVWGPSGSVEIPASQSQMIGTGMFDMTIGDDAFTYKELYNWTNSVPKITPGGGGGGGGLATVSNAFSMAFNGTDEYIEVNQVNFPPSLLDDFSVSFWVNMAPVSAGTYTRRHPVSVSTSVSDLDQSVHLRAWNTQYRVRQVGSVTPTGGVGTTDLSDNNWHHIAYTYEYDPSTTYYNTKIYVDGNTTPEVSASMRTTGGYATKGLHTIGVLSDYVAPYNLNAGTYFPGFIDEVALFTSSLDASTVESIYSASLPLGSGVTGDLTKLNTPPVAWYRMGD